MTHSNALSFNKQTLKTKDLESTSNIGQDFRFTIPLATATLCLLNFNQSALATDINTHTANTPHYSYLSPSQNHSDISHQESLHRDGSEGFFSRILSLISYPFKNHVDNASKADLKPQAIFKANVMGGSIVQDLAPVYLSQTQSSSTKEFLTAATIKGISPQSKTVSAKKAVDSKLHKVKTGDTISIIAKKYQVSRQELIALNKIKNSNVIFINQELEIPATKSQPATIALTKANFPQNSKAQINLSRTRSNRVANSQLNSNSISKLEIKTNSAKIQDERLANLRMEINQMRNEIEQEKKNQNTTVDLTKADVVSSIDVDANQNSDLISQEAASAKLPPLPSSEEYLPEAFDGYAWPAQGVLSSGYGWRWGRLHKGIDIAAPVGTPVFAAAAGEVVSAGWNSGGYGNLVKLQHLDGSLTLYAHNNRILVSSGQKVNQGEQIAEMGNTGFSTGSHLHFEIHSRNQGVVNPLALLD